jgi:hypothetical protein
MLLAISITELLSAWNIIKDMMEQPEWKFLIFFLTTETIPTLVIACLL